MRNEHDTLVEMLGTRAATDLLTENAYKSIAVAHVVRKGEMASPLGLVGHFCGTKPELGLDDGEAYYLEDWDAKRRLYYCVEVSKSMKPIGRAWYIKPEELVVI